MKTHTPLRLWIALGLALGLLTAGGAVLAAPPSNLTLQPSTVNSAFASTIVITGAGIVPGAQVVLDNFGALATTDVTTGTLTAVVPAGLPAGTYTVRVINPNGESAAVPTPLTVLGGTATPAPTAFVRPQLVVVSYGASAPVIAPGADYDFEMTLQNAGGETATNIVAEFPEGDFLPRVTGGIRALGALGSGQTVRFFQPLYATRALAEKKVATLEVKVTYTTAAGTNYSDSFKLTFPVNVPFAGTAVPTVTPTARALLRPQMIIKAYRADVDQLQPGFQFELALEVENVGNAQARRLTMVVGGGSANDLANGTPTGPGGVSGGGGTFTDFAPVGSSNVQSLGELDAKGTLTARQRLIVNAATKAGAYPLKISFVYVDERGQTYVDDQVVTLLVFQTPQLELSFYQDVGPLFVGQPNALPVQVVNLGRTTAVLGNMKVTSEAAPGAQFSQNVVLVGALDPGNTYPLDAVVIPDQAGPLELTVTVDYTDDFNQPQKITAQLTVEVLENQLPPDGGEVPPDGGEVPPDGGQLPETTGEMVIRFLKGFFGLDSARPSTNFGPVLDGPAVSPVIRTGP